MSSQIHQQKESAVLRAPSARWFAALNSAEPAELPGYDCRRVVGSGRARHLYLRGEIGSDLPLVAERSGCGVIFDGALYNRQDLQYELGDFMAPAGSNDAETILAGYLRWGEEFFGRLRGSFALVIWDTVREVFLCLRDPLGSCPLFYTKSTDGLLVSTSIDVLLAQPQVSGSLNRAALADFLLDRFPINEETYFSAIKRVTRGDVLRVKGDRQDSYCYWDPAPDGTVNWIKPDELERFDELFDQAVSRCLSFGPAAIFLSGGLDSGSVAAVAAERSRAEGLPKPVALSLVFPDPRISEEVVQRSVATQLGLPLIVKPFYEAVGARGLLQPALELSASLPSPLLNTWWPAYYGLAEEGARRGCRVILTGNGGDEWLTVSPLLAADLLRDFDFAGVYKLWKSVQRSYHEPTFALFRNLIWRWGIEPLLLPPAHRIVKRVAPWAITLRHRLVQTMPKWLAPDPSLREDLDHRRHGQALSKRQAPDSFYLRSARTALDIPLISMVSEEAFNVGQRLGARELHPFWDADLIGLLYRTPPFLLNNGGRNKGLVRSTLARRFPQIGFNEQRKMGASSFYATSIYREGGEALRQLGEIRILADLGIVDDPGLRDTLQGILARQPEGQAYHIWKVLNLESWARTHAS
jgi:asparagine synthetase B (glutamine-hydrolysing)